MQYIAIVSAILVWFSRPLSIVLALATFGALFVPKLTTKSKWPLFLSGAVLILDFAIVSGRGF